MELTHQPRNEDSCGHIELPFTPTVSDDIIEKLTDEQKHWGHLKITQEESSNLEKKQDYKLILKNGMLDARIG